MEMVIFRVETVAVSRMSPKDWLPRHALLLARFRRDAIRSCCCLVAPSICTSMMFDITGSQKGCVIRNKPNARAT